MTEGTTVKDNVREILRRNLLRGPTALLSEVVVLYGSLHQKFPHDDQSKIVVKEMEPLYEAAVALDVELTVALAKQWIGDKQV